MLGGPPDVVLEAVGGPGMIAEAAECVRPRGTIVVLGACWVPDPWMPVSGLFKEARIQFSMMYGMRDYELVADVLKAGAPELTAMITDTVPLDRISGRVRSPAHAHQPMQGDARPVGTIAAATFIVTTATPRKNKE